MESINTDCVKIKNTDIFNFWLRNNRNATTVVNWIFTKFNRSVDEERIATIKKKINNFCAYANQKWNKNHRCLKTFEKYESLWLSKETEFKFSESDVGNKRGRPHVGYSEGSARQKRKLASEISSVQGHDTKLLVHAASISAHASKANDLNFVLKEVASSPSRATKIRQVITCHEKKPLPLSPEEALLFLIENNLTKQQYINIREMKESKEKFAASKRSYFSFKDS